MQPSISSELPQAGAYSYGYPATVPSSREGALVFPVDRQNGKVEYWMYSPAMTQGAISIEEVAAVLQGVDAFIQPIFTSKLITFLKCFPWIILPVIPGMFVFFFACTFGLIIIDMPFYLFPIMISVTMVVLIIVAAVFQCLLASYIREKTKEAKEKIQPYLQLHNDTFQARGYFWVAPVHFPYWIELWRESSAQGIPVMPGAINFQRQEEQGDPVYAQPTTKYGGIELKSRQQKGYMELV